MYGIAIAIIGHFSAKHANKVNINSAFLSNAKATPY